MQDIVIVLGAGASRASGCPLMNDFFDQAENIFYRSTNENIRRDWERVQLIRSALVGLTSRSRIDIRNLEDVLSTVQLVSDLEPNWLIKDVEAHEGVKSIGRMIVSTLEECQRFACFPVDKKVLRVSGEPVIRPRSAAGYDNLCLALQILFQKYPSRYRVTFISFNYDIGLDISLSMCNINYSYGLSDERQPGQVQLLKPHGSVHWYEKDGGINMLPISTLIGKGSAGDVNSSRVTVPVSGHLELLGAVPMIVPPTGEKAVARKLLGPVWRSAWEALGSASEIVVAGYSVPRTDVFFESLVTASGLRGGICKRFCVVNPDPVVADRVKQMLDGDMEKRVVINSLHFESWARGLYKKISDDNGTWDGWFGRPFPM